MYIICDQQDMEEGSGTRLCEVQLLGKLPAYIYRQAQLCFHQSAASSHSELDQQTCRGSSIGRACGSYLLRYSKPQGRGFEPRLRLFLYTADCSFCLFCTMSLWGERWWLGRQKIFFFCDEAWAWRTGLALDMEICDICV